jgi:UDP-glucose 4-epimerase
VKLLSPPSFSRQEWLITGGAGYIGAHIAEELISKGINIVIYDSLTSGLRSRIEYLNRKYNRKIDFIHGDILNEVQLRKVFSDHKFTGIIHAAGLKSVAESIEKPKEYFDVNLNGTKNLLRLAKEFDVKQFIFSSTAAVYGIPKTLEPVNEMDSTEPISPYGESKLMAEKEVREFNNGTKRFSTCLRFFNVIGTSAKELEDSSQNNLVPIVIKQIRNNQTPIVFGDQYKTKDGTCVRDYIDVRDIARAHYLAAARQKNLPSILNIGTSNGFSVKEIIGEVSSIFRGESVKPSIGDTRPGDPPFLVADSTLIETSLEFHTKYNLRDSILSLLREES